MHSSIIILNRMNAAHTDHPDEDRLFDLLQGTGVDYVQPFLNGVHEEAMEWAKSFLSDFGKIEETPVGSVFVADKEKIREAIQNLLVSFKDYVKDLESLDEQTLFKLRDMLGEDMGVKVYTDYTEYPSSWLRFLLNVLQGENLTEWEVVDVYDYHF